LLQFQTENPGLVTSFLPANHLISASTLAISKLFSTVSPPAQSLFANSRVYDNHKMNKKPISLTLTRRPGLEADSKKTDFGFVLENSMHWVSGILQGVVGQTLDFRI
jgi:hypothetical protein